MDLLSAQRNEWIWPYRHTTMIFQKIKDKPKILKAFRSCTKKSPQKTVAPIFHQQLNARKLSSAVKILRGLHSAKLSILHEGRINIFREMEDSEFLPPSTLSRK